MTAILTTEQTVRALATMTTKDEAGRHFTERYDGNTLASLEAEGLIEITRPIHPGTGLEYSEENWHVEVTPDGADLVDAFPEYHPSEL